MQNPSDTNQGSSHTRHQDSVPPPEPPAPHAEDANTKQPDSTATPQPFAAADDRQSLLPQQQARDVESEGNQVSPEGSSLPTPDVRYVLSGQPTGWAAMAETVRAYDEEKVKETKEDIDTLLVFAGLFSAVLTAFLVESYQRLSPDTSSQMLAVMQQIALQTAPHSTVDNTTNLASCPPANTINAASQPFQPSTSDIRVNVLWFSSLIFSLITASFGMLVKQWLREYLAVENPSPQARLRIRHFRYPELMQWDVFQIAAVLPILQQLSLGLFFIGLCYFTQSVHESVGHTSLPLVAGWAFCFSTVTILPVFFPRCPFKTTLLKRLLQSIHMLSLKAIQKVAVPLSDFHQMAALRWTLTFKEMLDNHALRSDEDKAITAELADLDILVDVDALQSNDELLGSMILESLHQLQPEWDHVVNFVLRVLEHRLQRNNLATGMPTPLNLRTLSRAGCTATIDILSRYSSSAISQHVQSDQAITRWSRSKRTMSAFYIFFSPTRYPLPQTGVAVLSQALQHKGTALIELLAHECPRPIDLSDDKFHLLISGLSKVLGDLDINLALSLRYFETLMNTRFRDAKETMGDALSFPNRNFSVHEDMEAWPWSSVITADGRMEAATLMISTIHRALAQLKKSALTDPLQVLARPKATVTTVALRPPPSRLVDGVVGMWNMSFVGKIDAYSHTQELRFRAAVEECLTMKESTLALLKALGQIKSEIIIYSQKEWAASPIVSSILFEDARHKLNNLIDGVNALSDTYALAVLKHNPRGEEFPTPISISHLLLIFYVVLHMVELPDATTFADQWKSLFTALTRLGYQTMPAPALEVMEPSTSHVVATPIARQLNDSPYDTRHRPDQPPDSETKHKDGHEKSEEYEARERLKQERLERERLEKERESHQTLVDLCLDLVEKHDVQVLQGKRSLRFLRNED